MNDNDSTSLTDAQAKLLDDLGKTAKGLRELLDDHDIPWRTFVAWRQDRAFEDALQDVFAWITFVQETDIRIGAAEALRRAQQFVRGRDLNFHPHHRAVATDLWKKARELDKGFPRRHVTRGKPGAASAIHPDHAADVEKILRRMEQLRRQALAERPPDHPPHAFPAPRVGLPAPAIAVPAPPAALPAPPER